MIAGLAIRDLSQALLAILGFVHLIVLAFERQLAAAAESALRHR